MSHSEICDFTATEMVSLIAKKELSVREVMDAERRMYGIDRLVSAAEKAVAGGERLVAALGEPDHLRAAAMLLAFYILVGERQGVPEEALSGTIQNDILKEFIAQKEYIYPPRPSMRLITDQFAFATERVPKWNTISISGYHIREAGSTAAEEIAFTIANGIAYVEAAIDAGLDVDAFGPRLSFFWNGHLNFFEEVAKFRASRRMWHTTLKTCFMWSIRRPARCASIPYRSTASTGTIIPAILTLF